MKKIKWICTITTVLMLCLTMLPYPAGAANSGTLLVVVDSSKETYGPELREDVSTQIKKQLQGIVKEQPESKDAANLVLAERSELQKLAEMSGMAKILIVEILPIKTDFSELLFYKALQSEATLRVRLYDAAKNQYLLTEETSGKAANKTYIPYTSVGKKPTVLKAVRQAAADAAKKIALSEEAKK